MDRATTDRIRGHLGRLYAAEVAQDTTERLVALLTRFAAEHPVGGGQARSELFDATDVWVIAYGDHIREPGRPPLATLRDVLDAQVGDVVGGLHLLPHYPSTSDDGFAVVDHLAVDPALGDWPEVERLGERFRLMLDAVVNHTSASAPWFQRWLADDLAVSDFYLSPDDDASLTQVVRPRTSPLVTMFDTPAGPRSVWTTFSADQVDLDFANPAVLVAVTEILLAYVGHGAGALRLDAVAFLWKEPGTSCIHLPQTHEVIRLWRTLLDAVAPGTLIVTETNVPHEENLSYFGAGDDEAHLVYQFALPPLVLHAFRRGDGSVLHRWLDTLVAPSDTTTFLNFLASHDGIGLRAVEGLLAPEDVVGLAAAIEAEGGRVSYRSLPDGRAVPYELNVTYFDALNPPDAGDTLERQVRRFLCAHALLLSLAGVPALYLHSLLGSRNWLAGVDQTGQPRSINRQKLDRAELARQLADPTSRPAQVLSGLRKLIAARVADRAFHPNAAQRRLPSNPGLVVVERQADGEPPRWCVHNLSDRTHAWLLPQPEVTQLLDLVTGQPCPVVSGAAGPQVEVGADEVRWLVDAG